MKLLKSPWLISLFFGVFACVLAHVVFTFLEHLVEGTLGYLLPIALVLMPIIAAQLLLSKYQTGKRRVWRLSFFGWLAEFFMFFCSFVYNWLLLPRFYEIDDPIVARKNPEIDPNILLFLGGAYFASLLSAWIITKISKQNVQASEILDDELEL